VTAITCNNNGTTLKLSTNDHVGDAGFTVVNLMADAPQRDENTGLYGVGGME